MAIIIRWSFISKSARLRAVLLVSVQKADIIGFAALDAMMMIGIKMAS